MIAPVGAKAISYAFGPVLATTSGLLLVAAQQVTTTAIEGNVLTLIASVLASTGVVGYAVKKFVDNQIARSQEERAEERLEKQQATATQDRLIVGYEAQIAKWEALYKEERDRNERLVSRIAGGSGSS
jgi:membrane protein YqaA with SNARE-associated domain